MDEADLIAMSSRYIPISINTKNIHFEEQSLDLGDFQGRIVTLVVSSQKHLKSPDKLDIWNQKGKLAFLDTVDKTIIFSPAVREKLQQVLGEDHAPVRFVQQEGDALVDLHWQVIDDDETFKNIIQQRQKLTTEKPIKESSTTTTGAPTKNTVQTLRGRVSETTQKISSTARLIETHFYLRVGQIVRKIQDAHRITQKELDQTKRDEAKHSEEVRQLRHAELNKSTERKTLQKIDQERISEDKTQRKRKPGTSIDAQQEPPTTANKSI